MVCVDLVFLGGISWELVGVGRVLSNFGFCGFDVLGLLVWGCGDFDYVSVA